MAKTRLQKADDVARIAEKFKGMKAAAFAQVSGLTMPQADDLRKKARTVGVEVFIAKKTILNLAAQAAGVQDLDTRVLEGSIITAIGSRDEVSAAKVLMEFRKTNEALVMVGGVLEGKGINAKEVNFLASLPTREQLLSQLVGSLNAPVSGFVNVLAGNLRGLVTVLDKVRAQKA